MIIARAFSPTAERSHRLAPNPSSRHRKLTKTGGYSHGRDELAEPTSRALSA